MIRLDFQLQDFTRVSWAPSADVWKDRITRISNLYQEIERFSVLTEAKPAALQSYCQKDLINVSQWAARNDLAMIVLGMQGQSPGYSNSVIPVEKGKPCDFRVAIIPQNNVELMIDGWTNSDDNRIGYCLGYPACCRAFFKQYWVDEGMVDTTWPMVTNSHHNKRSDGVLEVGGDPEANIFLRWLGVRLVSHLPCSVSCRDSVEIGKSFLQTMREFKYTEESEWLWEMLHWPVEWSALHGIAEIKTPVCKVISRTDATGDKLTIQKQGSNYPAEGASGITFPYTQRGVAPLQIIRPDNWTENGFKDAASMVAAHDTVLSVLPFSLREHHNVIDLGCGNGALLERICKNYGCHVYGIDLDQSKLERLLRKLQKVTVRATNIYDLDWNEHFHVALISVNRLREAFDWQREKLLTAIREHCDFLIAYTYDGQTFPLHWEMTDEAIGSGAKAKLYRIN